MRRHRQTLEELESRLSEIESSWMDEHAETVVQLVNSIPQKRSYCREDLRRVLETDFQAGLTVLRLALGMSKDELGIALASALGKGNTGVTSYKRDPDRFLEGIESLGVLGAITGLANKPVSWRDLLIERLKYGRGSAIKGQARGRSLEEFTERIVKRVFSDLGYDKRCRFVGATGTSTEKADFAIPTKEDPAILIESKGYGATGSKQTDILGDCERIDAQKRHDTDLLLVTDGVTWRQRLSDLRKLIEMQNHGRIRRIYTQSMADELESDLRQLRAAHSLG